MQRIPLLELYNYDIAELLALIGTRVNYIQEHQIPYPDGTRLRIKRDLELAQNKWQLAHDVSELDDIIETAHLPPDELPKPKTSPYWLLGLLIIPLIFLSK